MSSDLPTVVSLVPKRFEDGAWSGVPRFDWELRKLIPGLVSLNTSRQGKVELKKLVRSPETVVITGNETSLLVPDGVRTIVVHHGCAQTHYDRDPQWRSFKSRRFCRAQKKMYSLRNRKFISPAKWTADEFSRHYDVPSAEIIPHWVPNLSRERIRPDRPVIIGDWRNFNKGDQTVAKLKTMMPEFEFRQLDFTYETREAFYADADLYLCLSLSEGGSYSVADAEAASIPIATTDVGNHHEFADAVFAWTQRDDVRVVKNAIDKAMTSSRTNFFESWTKQEAEKSWSALVNGGKLGWER